MVFAALAMCACTEPLRPASQREGCHYVSCGDMFDGYDGPRCIVVVDNLSVANFATGQDALDFIRHNGLRTCTGAPMPLEEP
jgi:hypothetical protein